MHKDFQNQGVATAICDELEQHAKKFGLQKISVHASITAKPFFEGRGYVLEKSFLDRQDGENRVK